MFQLEQYEGMSPQEIHKAHIKKRMKDKAKQLRQRFRLEKEIKALSWDEKKAIKLKLLELYGYDKTKPIRSQGMKLRILYFLKLKDLHKNNWVIEYYEEQSEKDHGQDASNFG